MSIAPPLPVSALLRRARNARSAKERHDTAYFAWEASLILAVAARPPQEVTQLARPSVGAWAAALQAPDERLADEALAALLALLQEVGQGRKGAPRKASAREILDALPAYRNQVIGHGSTRAAEFYEDAGHLLVEALERAWAAGWFLREGERLTHVEAVELDPSGRRRARLLDLTGEVGHVVDPRGTPDVPPDVLPQRTYLRTQDRWRPMHPWVLCQEDEARERVYLFASLTHRAKALDYVSGEALAGDALEAVFPGVEKELEALFRAPAGSHAAAAAPVGEQLGAYRILGPLGAGGMGRVVHARVEGAGARLPPGTEVALKIVHPHLAENPAFLKRFQREAELGRRIVHENVVRTFDVETVHQDGRAVHFLVMEHVQGQTLRALVAELGRVPEELCRHIGREVARGLSAIHAGGVVHQDIKPENVLITREHVVKVMDLGVARLADESTPWASTTSFMGSVQYAAPEQFEAGQAITPRTDLYALGATLYELATGTKPYVDEDVHKTLRRILSEAPRRCSELNPQLSPFFEELVHTLLARRPEERFADAPEVARVLEDGEASAWWKAHAQAIRATTQRPLRRIRIPRETALYGREGELQRLQALYARARAGEGQVVLIDGEAGIGKSRLVDELVAQLQRDGEDIAFLHGSYPPGGAATVSGAFTTAYREQFGAEGLEETLKPYLAESPALVPAFAALLRGEGVPAGVEGLTKDSLQTVFIRSTQHLAAERTTIVLIDDLHFAPEEGRALWMALAMAVAGHRILLVGTTRPGLEERWLANLDRIGAARLSLARLGPKDLARLLVDALRSEHLAQELSYRIGAKSDGNPFFVFEILRGLREGHFLSQRPDGSWATTQVIADITIPSSILELVQARVSDLDDAERQMLDVAACVGFEFDPLLVAQVLGLAKIPAMQALARIEKRHRLVRSVGRRFVFDQSQVQEACYQGLPEILREEYHGLIADAIEAQHLMGRPPTALEGNLASDLAHHLFQAGRPERALVYLPAALAHRDRSCMGAAAAELGERALACPGLLTGHARCELLVQHARRLDLLGRPEAEIRALQEAKQLADDALLRTRVRNELGDLYRRLARYDEARAELEDALALARASADRVNEACVQANLASVAWYVGKFDAALAAGQAALELARSVGHAGHEATAEGNLGIVCWSLGRMDEARAHYERSLRLYREGGNRASEALTAANLGLACMAQGRLGEARQHFEDALRVSRSIGYRPGEGHATACLGEVCVLLGLLGEARAHLERRIALSRECGDRASLAGATLQLGQLLIEQGEPQEGLARIREALDACRAIHSRWDEAQALLTLGAALAQGNLVEPARAHLAEAYDLGVKLPLPGVRLVAGAWLATLPGPEREASVGRALADLAECGAATSLPEGMQARYLLWQATGERTHLEAARRALDTLIDGAPPECRDGLRTGLRLHRNIAGAGEPPRPRNPEAPGHGSRLT